jgi:hypothetical protein
MSLNPELFLITFNTSSRCFYHQQDHDCSQLYKRREIAKIKWIDSDSNPANAITKSKPSTALKQLIDTNYIKLKAVEWVERVTDDGTDPKA